MRIEGGGRGLRPNLGAAFRRTFSVSLYRNSFFLLATAILSNGLGFLFWLAIARSYPPAAVGVAAAILSMVLFLARAAGLGFPVGMIRFLPESTNKTALINGALTVSGLAALILGIAFLAGLDVWAPALTIIREDPLYAAAFVVSLFFFTFDGIVDNAFVATRRAGYATFRTTLYNVMRLPLGLAFAASVGNFGIPLAWTLALVVSVLVSMSLLPRFYSGYRPALRLEQIRRTGMIRFSLWNYGSGLVAGAGVSLLPLIVLNTLRGAEGAVAAAFFYAAWALADLLHSLPHAFNTSLYAEGSQPGSNYAQDIRRTFRFSVPLVALGIAGAIVLGQDVLRLFGEEYAKASYPTLVLLALTTPIILLSSIFTTSLRVTKRARPIFFVSTTAMVITLAVAYLLLPTIGILGAGIGFTAGQVSSLALFALERTLHRRRTAKAPG